MVEGDFCNDCRDFHLGGETCPWEDFLNEFDPLRIEAREQDRQNRFLFNQQFQNHFGTIPIQQQLSQSLQQQNLLQQQLQPFSLGLSGFGNPFGLLGPFNKK